MIISLKEKIEEHYKKEFISEEVEYNDNFLHKKNLVEYVIECYIKNELDIVSKKKTLADTLGILSEFTGCADDLEILEKLLDILIEKNIIDKKEYNNTIEMSSVSRWL